MSRDDLPRARSLVRLRDITLDAAMRALGAATVALAQAEEVVATAVAARCDRAADLRAARAALAEDPATAANGLARIILGSERVDAAEAALADAEQARRIAEDAVIAARTAARRANARRDAMAEHATQMRRVDNRAAEERAAIESEEGAAAMRIAS